MTLAPPIYYSTFISKEYIVFNYLIIIVGILIISGLLILIGYQLHKLKPYYCFQCGNLLYANEIEKGVCLKCYYEH